MNQINQQQINQPKAPQPRFSKGEELSFPLSQDIVESMETKPLFAIWKAVVVSCSTDGQSFFYTLASPKDGHLLGGGAEVEESAILENVVGNSNRQKVF